MLVLIAALQITGVAQVTDGDTLRVAARTAAQGAPSSTAWWSAATAPGATSSTPSTSCPTPWRPQPAAG